MKKYFATLVVLLAPFYLNAQVVFEKGYIINLDGQHTECLIQNKKWLRTPEQLTYKLSENDELKYAGANELKEFGVGDFRFISALVNIDQTPKDLSKIDSNKHPVWVKTRLFLRVLSEGKASLYMFAGKSYDRFFLRTDGNDSIRQLVYKAYRANSTHVSYNTDYVSQLIAEVFCTGLEISAKRVKYTAVSLVNYFDKYNTCHGTVTERPKPKRKSEFHLTLTPGVDISNAIAENAGVIVEYERENSLRYAVEAEFMLPFNSRKWAIFLEPTYQTYETTIPFKAVMKSLEAPVGLRYYMYLNDNARFFINVAAVVDYEFETEVKIRKTARPSGTTQSIMVNLAAGAGFKYSRFGLEGRYYTDRTRTGTNVQLLVQQKFSLIFGVRLF
jgi:hypothetical protein